MSGCRAGPARLLFCDQRLTDSLGENDVERLSIDMEYVVSTLMRLLEIPSPSGYTGRVTELVTRELRALGIPFERTRRGAIRADLRGREQTPDRALVAHLDTLGAMVKGLKPNGRLEVVPIGEWSSRFAEGARVTVLSDGGSYRGSILPLKASGHAYDVEVDRQPVSWANLEVRIDAVCRVLDDLVRCGIRVGDFIAVDAAPEIVGDYINARHLDDKAGVAVLLGAARAVVTQKIELPVDCHLLFTIMEEVGSGASAGLHGDVAEMVTVDNAVMAPGQNSVELGVTIAMKDMSGPFDYHLTHHLLDLCRQFEVVHARDVFVYYRSDSASAVEAGNDMRTALACFGLDGSHGYERVHRDSLHALAELLTLYMQSERVVVRDPSDGAV